jgi:hypothetical protein
LVLFSFSGHFFMPSNYLTPIDAVRLYGSMEAAHAYQKTANAYQQLAKEPPVIERPPLTIHPLDCSTDTTALMAAMQAQIDQLRADMNVLLAKQPFTLDGGKLPSRADMSRLECQIFHTPDLVADAKKRKTVWSLKLQVWAGTRRATTDVDVALYPGEQFYRAVMACTTVPKSLDELANAIQHNDDVLAGMLRGKTYKKGAPYITTQFCVLAGHLDGNPMVHVMADEQLIEFDGFRPGAGTKAGRAKWYADVVF